MTTSGWVLKSAQDLGACRASHTLTNVHIRPRNEDRHLLAMLTLSCMRIVDDAGSKRSVCSAPACAGLWATPP